MNPIHTRLTRLRPPRPPDYRISLHITHIHFLAPGLATAFLREGVVLPRGTPAAERDEALSLLRQHFATTPAMLIQFKVFWVCCSFVRSFVGWVSPFFTVWCACKVMTDLPPPTARARRRLRRALGGRALHALGLRRHGHAHGAALPPLLPFPPRRAGARAGAARALPPLSPPLCGDPRGFGFLRLADLLVRGPVPGVSQVRTVVDR